MTTVLRFNSLKYLLPFDVKYGQRLHTNSKFKTCHLFDHILNTQQLTKFSAIHIRDFLNFNIGEKQQYLYIKVSFIVTSLLYLT